MGFKTNKTIILGSASLDRKELLEKVSIPFKVIISGFNEEDIGKNIAYERLVLDIAKGKCESVLRKINTSSDYSDIKNSKFVIISADTMVICDNKVIGKPRNKEDAYKILNLLSGREHFLITGVIIYDSESAEFTEIFDSTQVTFSKLTDSDIYSYLNGSEEYRTRAGAYSLRERASLFISKINGSPSNVIGLPMDKIFTSLKKFGINLLN